MNYEIKRDRKNLKCLIGERVGNPYVTYNILKDDSSDSSFILISNNDKIKFILFNDPNSHKFGTIKYDYSHLLCKEEIERNEKIIYNQLNPIISCDGLFKEFREEYLNESKNVEFFLFLNEKLQNPLLWLKSKVNFEDFDLIIYF